MVDLNNVVEKDRLVYEAIYRYKEEHRGRSPSLRMIVTLVEDKFDISPQGVRGSLDRLAEAGLVVRPETDHGMTGQVILVGEKYSYTPPSWPWQWAPMLEKEAETDDPLRGI